MLGNEFCFHFSYPRTSRHKIWRLLLLPMTLLTVGISRSHLGIHRFCSVAGISLSFIIKSLKYYTLLYTRCQSETQRVKTVSSPIAWRELQVRVWCSSCFVLLGMSICVFPGVSEAHLCHAYPGCLCMGVDWDSVVVHSHSSCDLGHFPLMTSLLKVTSAGSQPVAACSGDDRIGIVEQLSHSRSDCKELHRA